jgi:hypothetical protein
MMSARLQLLEGHLKLNVQQTAQQKSAASTNFITDGQKKYPETVDYHPEKKVQ